MKKLFLLIPILFIMCVSFSYAGLNDNVYSHYKFDEANINFGLIDMIGLNDIPVINNVSTQPSKIGTYSRGQFNDTNYFYTTTHTFNFSVNNNYTINFWIYRNNTNSTSNDHYLYTIGGNVVNNFQVGLSYNFPSNKLEYHEVKYGVCGNNGFSNYTNFSVGLWNMVSIVKNNGSTILYVNGVNQNMSMVGGCSIPVQNVNKFYIGENPDLLRNALDFNIDEFTIWNETKSQSDITSLYNNGNGLSFPFAVSSTNIICDTTNCLWKDDFYLNTSVNGWTGSTNITDVQNNTLFFNSYVFNQNTLITHNFISEDIYNKIEYYITFDLNYEITPLSLNYSVNQNSHTFSTWLTCSDGSYPMNLNFDVFSWNTYSGNYDYTTFYGYNLFSSGYTPIGLFDTKNNGFMVFRILIDKSLNKLYIYNTPFTNNYDIDIYTFDEQTPTKILDIPTCNKYSSVSLMRRDVDYTNTTYDIGIKQIIVRGDVETSAYVSPFLYINATTNANATIKTDIGENVQDLAFKYGFKTTGSKLLLWFIIMMIGIIVIFKNANNLGAFATSIVTTFFTITIFVLGWYLGFIPTALLVFVVFMSAIVGAVVIKNLFSGGN